MLADLKRARGVVKKNPGASLIDLGDGVLCCEFHSKANAMGDDIMLMVRAGLAELEANFEAMVIGNQGENFSAGANLMMVLLAAQEQEWDELNAAINSFQQMNMALKYAAKPVVAAPFGLALGGGCELPMHCTRVQASAELYMGLVEVGVGLIPAGGGCKEMLLRSRDTRKIFEQIGFAKVATSAAEARQFRYLRDGDGISMNPERLIDDAKHLALSLVPGYAAGAPRTDITVSGDEGFALMKMGVWMAQQGGYISAHRCGDWREAGLCSQRRAVDRNASGFRAVYSRSGTGSLPQSLRAQRDATTDSAHAEDGQAASELEHRSFTVAAR